MNLPHPPGDSPAHVERTATKLKEVAEVVMQGFEKGWLCYRWQGKKHCSSQNLDVLNTFTNVDLDTESLLLWGSQKRKWPQLGILL